MDVRVSEGQALRFDDEGWMFLTLTETTLCKAHADRDVRAPSMSPELCNYFS
jgi:hypothetical protein